MNAILPFIRPEIVAFEDFNRMALSRRSQLALSRPSLLKALSRKSKNPAGFFSCLGPEGPQHQT
jgi:hypothetical protein